MKFKTTAKAIREGCGRVVSAGYCDLCNLLTFEDPVAYTCGVYGWNFDVYQVDGLTICTGYRGMVGRTANNIREYEARARKINEEMMWKAPYEERKAAIRALLAEFVKQA